jgi:hypothetical protein
LNHPVIIRLDRNNKTKKRNDFNGPQFEEAFNAYSLKNQILNPKKRYEESDHRSKTPGLSDTNTSVIQPTSTFLPKLSSMRTSRKAPFNIEVNGSH